VLSPPPFTLSAGGMTTKVFIEEYRENEDLIG